MAMLETSSPTDHVTPEAARTELARFFTIAETAERAPEMFSAYIDAEWHRLLGTPEYETLCRQAVGHGVGHRPDAGSGTPSWIAAYHERFGRLPAVWFAAADGSVDTALRRDYLNGVPFVTAWDCTPTTNDEDD
ncbi:hypothetical protein KIK06_09575 [Nocardiopsis sp. EMB25]|uniref:hypothetical protein n=1 Tax=Nocardiopsis sp. EMB25 TaxID=2835867 RepID=UPI002284197C|nr:hypothetical protein [Nocardiopsis sp. EMB25]MCY9784142.1 hypothetical protein [Nocardiopsis sp. EMB25]